MRRAVRVSWLRVNRLEAVDRLERLGERRVLSAATRRRTFRRSRGIKATQKGQVLTGVKLAVLRRTIAGSSGRQSPVVDVAEHIRPRRGTQPADAGEPQHDFFRVYETAYRRLVLGLLRCRPERQRPHERRPGTNAAPTFDRRHVAGSEAHGFGLDGRRRGRASARCSTRDNPINANHGWLANAVTGRSTTGSPAAIRRGRS